MLKNIRKDTRTGREEYFAENYLENQSRIQKNNLEKKNKMTLEEIEARRNEKREKDRIRKSRMTPEEIEARREREKNRYLKKKSLMTDVDLQARREKDNERY